MMRPMPNEGSITEGVKLLRAPETLGSSDDQARHGLMPQAAKL